MNENDFLDAINQTMPFGKYKGRKLIDLPEPYLVWFHGQGFPQGRRNRSRRFCGIHSIHGDKLGAQLALVYEIKLNGLEAMVKRI